jgi:hypothetical protein
VLVGQDPLQEFLKFGFAVDVALPLNFLREQIHGAHVMRIDLYRLTEFDDGLRGIAASTFEHSGQIVNLVVLRHQFLRSPQALRSRIEVSLA